VKFRSGNELDLAVLMDLWNATGALALEHPVWILLPEGVGGVQRWSPSVFRVSCADALQAQPS
jgi:hypothetical protein